MVSFIREFREFRELNIEKVGNRNSYTKMKMISIKYIVPFYMCDGRFIQYFVK